MVPEVEDMRKVNAVWRLDFETSIRNVFIVHQTFHFSNFICNLDQTVSSPAVGDM